MIHMENQITQTKAQSPSAFSAIDALSADAAVDLMLDGQKAAITAVGNAATALAEGARVMSEAIRAGCNLVYAAAGSSGLMALADACELPGTFGVPAARIRIHMAGGVPTSAAMTGDVEDDVTLADSADFAPGDAAIILSASGTTPYALAMSAKAREAGARIIAITCTPNTPLLASSDIPICLITPTEVVAGSTRLAAGTAQKAALNAMSTLMGIQLGHVYQGMMVNLIADNAKLRHRATQVVQTAAGVPEVDAKGALQAAEGAVKPAILIASGRSAAEANTLLAQHHGHLAPCLNHNKTKLTKYNTGEDHDQTHADRRISGK